MSRMLPSRKLAVCMPAINPAKTCSWSMASVSRRHATIARSHSKSLKNASGRCSTQARHRARMNARILTKFRQGGFDILVGVNLLREGLDLPEVELVGILDADKEGFLRSETSLIQ